MNKSNKQMKEKIKKDYFGRTRKFLKTNLFNRNLIRREKALGDPPSKMTWIILKVD